MFCLLLTRSAHFDLGDVHVPGILDSVAGMERTLFLLTLTNPNGSGTVVKGIDGDVDPRNSTEGGAPALMAMFLQCQHSCAN